MAPCVTNVASMLVSRMYEFGENVAQVSSETREEILYSDLLREVARGRTLLRGLRLHKEDLVLLLASNTQRFAPLLLSALLAQVPVLLVSAFSKKRELEHALNLSGCRWVLHTGLEPEQEAFLRLKGQTLVNFSQQTPSFPDGPTSSEVPTSSEDRPALVLLSSGSTGLPKGVMLSHRNLVTALHSSKNWLRPASVALGLMPFYHAYGLVIMLLALYRGATLVTMSRFNLQHFLTTISEHKVSDLHLVPSLLKTLLTAEKEALSSVARVWTGAGALSPFLRQALKDNLPSVVLHHSYGMTETTFVAFCTLNSEAPPSSAGVVQPSFQAKVVDEDGEEVEDGKVGELWLRGDMVTKGYWRNLQATEELFPPGQDWLRTGDLAYRDTGGHFFIVDRIKEIIKYQGHQVSPSEVEGILEGVEGVAEAAVVGRPHPECGELPQALVVKTKPSSVTQEQLLALVREELSSYKQLRGGVRFVDFIPRTPSGKVKRSELKQLYLQ